MSNDDLPALIDALKDEIQRLDPGDKEARARLESLVADIERRLETDGGSVEPDDELMVGLREAVERFEVEHPRATGIVNNIMVMLGSMGI